MSGRFRYQLFIHQIFYLTHLCLNFFLIYLFVFLACYLILLKDFFLILHHHLILLKIQIIFLFISWLATHLQSFNLAFFLQGDSHEIHHLSLHFQLVILTYKDLGSFHMYDLPHRSYNMPLFGLTFHHVQLALHEHL